MSTAPCAPELPQAPEPSRRRKARSPSTIRNPFAEWAVTLLILLFASTSLAWSYVVPTGSMEKTLLIGDHIVVDKLAYARPGPISRYLLPYQEPKHGDIFAFRYPADPEQTFVKRVIGVPGDRLRIVNGQLYRNGAQVREPYVWHSRPFLDSFQTEFPPADIAWTDAAPDVRRDVLQREMLRHHVVNGELVVPAGCFFAMGDNRDNSLDSRYWGFVPRENVIGKPAFVYWSYNAPTSELMPGSVADVARHMLDVGEHFFTRTRWDRTLRLVRGYPEAR